MINNNLLDIVRGGDFREPTLRKLGLNGDDVRFVVTVLDKHGITKCPGKRQRRKLVVPPEQASQLVLDIPVEQLHKDWKKKRTNTHIRKPYVSTPAEHVLISGDQLYEGATYPASEILTPPEKIFTKAELQRGEGYGEFDTGAKATVIETGDVYLYNGYRWVKEFKA